MAKKLFVGDRAYWNSREGYSRPNQLVDIYRITDTYVCFNTDDVSYCKPASELSPKPLAMLSKDRVAALEAGYAYVCQERDALRVALAACQDHRARLQVELGGTQAALTLIEGFATGETARAALAKMQS